MATRDAGATRKQSTCVQNLPEESGVEKVQVKGVDVMAKNLANPQAVEGTRNSGRHPPATDAAKNPVGSEFSRENATTRSLSSSLNSSVAEFVPSDKEVTTQLRETKSSSTPSLSVAAKSFSPQFCQDDNTHQKGAPPSRLRLAAAEFVPTCSAVKKDIAPDLAIHRNSFVSNKNESYKKMSKSAAEFSPTNQQASDDQDPCGRASLLARCGPRLGASAAWQKRG